MGGIISNGVTKKSVYAPDDVSYMLQVPLETVGTWIATGQLASFQIPGNHVRIRRDAFEKFLQDQNVPLPPQWNETQEQKFKILVVEDDADMLEIIGELLNEEITAEVQMESSGFGAALKISQWHPDLILLDFVMPGMDGFEVCAQLKKNLKTRDIPILAITSLSSVENKRAVMESGVSAFLGKPFQADRMLRMVREILGVPQA